LSSLAHPTNQLNVTDFQNLKPRAGKITPVTELPTWAIWLAVFLLPIIGFVAGLIPSWLSRKAAIEAHLRWAAELVVSDDPRKAQLGVDELRALANRHLLSKTVKSLIDAALASSIEKPLAVIEAADKAGEETQVIQVDVEAIEAGHLPLVDEDGAAAEDGNGEEHVRGA
jgi:hypothetical protein